MLSEVTKEDIECYEGVVTKMFQKKTDLSRFSKHFGNFLSGIEFKNEYNENRIIEHLQEIKNKMAAFTAKLRELKNRREKYYSGFVCSMCSPTFSKFFTRLEEPDKENPNFKYELEINQFMCKSIMQTKIDMMLSFNIYLPLQDLINLSYCVRKNSKKDLLDYDDADLSEYIINNIDPQAYATQIERERRCINEEDAFISDTIPNIDCHDTCKQNLDFFGIMVPDLSKQIRAENDFTQMLNNLTPEQAKARLEERLKSYLTLKQEEIDKGFIKNSKKRDEDKLAMLIETPGHIFHKKNTRLTVSRHLGLNVNSTPMDSRYYKSQQIFSYFVVFLGAILYFQL
jgi:hypothetical protein